jgi:hypothetical protein
MLLAKAGIQPPVGSVGVGFKNDLAKTLNGPDRVAEYHVWVCDQAGVIPFGFRLI